LGSSQRIQVASELSDGSELISSIVYGNEASE